MSELKEEQEVVHISDIKTMKKKPTLYIIIITAWLCCTAFLVYSLTTIAMGLNEYSTVKTVFIIILLAINTAVLSILWFGSIKDLTFSIAYAVLRKKLDKQYKKIEDYKVVPDSAPRFLLLYCTCNDFNPKALSACRKQDYPNFKTIILDDSSDPKYIKEINKYRVRHGNVEVVRRTDRTGYKAGNLNNYLKDRHDYDYFVVLDSDEVIPPDYITKVLKYFNYNQKCGAVQAKHIAQEGDNVFQRLMGLCVGSNGTTVQVIKNFYGANALIGHGMTISRTCYEATGGFPLVVAEDISFAVEIKNAGLDIIYAPDILCYEEFPVNYVSLKKRQCKWTQGNLEYMKKYNKQINESKMSWFEKLDIKLSHYSLPIVPVLSFLLAICTITLGFLGYPIIRYSLGVYFIMILFLCSPMIPDLYVYHKNRNVFLLLPYFIVNIATYASLAPMMLKTVLLGICGKKAVFLVTPKSSEKFSFKEILKYSYDSILFAVLIGTLSYFACGSVLPVIFIVVGCLLAPFIISLSNYQIKEKGYKAKTNSIAKKKSQVLRKPLFKIPSGSVIND
ncbi:MAG: glycosyltransferase [Huintestinicola sp.]